MRWKALQFLGKFDYNTIKTDLFKSQKWPQAIDETKDFEKRSNVSNKNIVFQNFKNAFHEKLANNIKEIKNTNKTIIQADKTRNYIKLTMENR